jgi:hypothetical protein
VSVDSCELHQSWTFREGRHTGSDEKRGKNGPTGAILAVPVIPPAAEARREGPRKSTNPPKTAKSGRRVVKRVNLSIGENSAFFEICQSRKKVPKLTCRHFRK